MKQRLADYVADFLAAHGASRIVSDPSEIF